MSASKDPTETLNREDGLSTVSVAISALLLSAVLLVIAPLLGVVSADDGSSTSPPVHSGWVAAVPLLAVVALALSRRGLALAAVAGLGAFGLVRLIADVGVVIDPGETLRPELFGIQTLTANPLHTGWAAWMLVLADLLMLAAAARAANVVADTLEPVGGRNSGRLELGASDETAVGQSLADESGRRPRLMKTSPSTVVGIIAAAGYLAANLGEAYSDPLPVIRPGFTDIGLWGSITAATAGLLLAMAVLLSSALDSGTARGLLIGLGLGATGPPLVVIIGSIGNDTATPSALAWLALASSFLLLVAGMLRREALPIQTESRNDGAAPVGADEVTPDPGKTHRWNVLLGIMALVAAALSMAAYLLPQASFVFRSYLGQDTSSEPALSDEDLSAAFAPAGSIFVLVAAVFLIAGVLTLVPLTQRWGRAALTLAWAPAIAAFLFSLQYVNQVRSPELVAGVVFQADTTFRSGLWVGLAGTVLAIAAGIFAPLVSGRVDDASDEDIPEVELADRAPWAHITVGGLTILVVIGIGPAAWTSDLGSSAGLFAGADRTDFWGIWLTAIAVIIAILVAVRNPRREVALSLFLASAVVLLPRLIIDSDVRGQAGFSILMGFWLNIILVVAVLVAGVVVWKLIGAPTWIPASGSASSFPSTSGGKPMGNAKVKGGKTSAAAPTRANGPSGKSRPR